MSFIDFIENLQKKPKNDRVKIFMITMIAMIVIIVAIFGFSTSRILRNIGQGKVNESIDEPNKNLPSIAEVIKSSIGGVLNLKKEIEEGFGGASAIDSVKANVGGHRLPEMR